MTDTLKIVFTTGTDELARVFVAELADGKRVEFVESIQPPVPRNEKWVLIISTLKGCPIRCPMCDAGKDYHGRLTAEELFAQIDFLIRTRFPDGKVDIPKLKIQFARMGDPALNNNVLDVLKHLPDAFDAPGLMPCISTIAPSGTEEFMDELISIKNSLYPNGKFQMQFSLHSTDEDFRRKMIPAKIWTFEKLGEYGRRFFAEGDRKIALNFAPAIGAPLDPSVLAQHFSPIFFCIKLTPINPTASARKAGLASLIKPEDGETSAALIEGFEKYGFETILSIGELEENRIGSNCGMYVSRTQDVYRLPYHPS